MNNHITILRLSCCQILYEMHHLTQSKCQNICDLNLATYSPIAQLIYVQVVYTYLVSYMNNHMMIIV